MRLKQVFGSPRRDRPSQTAATRA